VASKILELGGVSKVTPSTLACYKSPWICRCKIRFREVHILTIADDHTRRCMNVKWICLLVTASGQQMSFLHDLSSHRYFSCKLVIISSISVSSGNGPVYHYNYSTPKISLAIHIPSFSSSMDPLHHHLMAHHHHPQHKAAMDVNDQWLGWNDAGKPSSPSLRVLPGLLMHTA
jgi:hypothetical protein